MPHKEVKPTILLKEQGNLLLDLVPKWQT